MKKFIDVNKHYDFLKMVFDDADCCHCPIGRDKCSDITGTNCAKQLFDYFVETDPPTLEPCPCCGSKNIHMISDDASAEIVCLDCGMKTSEEIFAQDAIKKWNTRIQRK